MLFGSLEAESLILSEQRYHESKPKRHRGHGSESQPVQGCGELTPDLRNPLQLHSPARRQPVEKGDRAGPILGVAEPRSPL